ncbi:RNA 2',3'-cyclic phosphodiesterase [Nitrococcus mobilis]|uniref:RNA 2',3'-cyclic phosphodiesterase n=1 Tax=Nitrococcus mobilis Nb-231 TaxID=314278 RepID=A4BU36_9GAMM|nr:RNA 2',3'-cyclic phosphodiesterase [Nitrococcus mobilis]EAR20710.1 2'-5' RNA ligase, putative [Nitrococcus mobilis Nb-231]
MPDNCSDGDTQRLFLALWPDEGVRCAVARLARRLVPDGRLVPPENLHVTLAFLGDVPGEAMPRVRAIGANLVGATFALELDRIGCWPRPRISWIAPSHTPAVLGRLNRELRQVLRKAGFPVPSRRFAPHMTLARRSAPHAFHDVTPVVWPIERITLIRSHLERAGARYEILCEWPLQPRNTKGWESDKGGTSPGNMK